MEYEFKFELGTCTPPLPDGAHAQTRLGFIDCDDVRDRETGRIHPQAFHLLKSWGVPIFLSTSGTGLHGYGWTTLPEGKRPSCEIDLRSWEHTEEPSIEFYGQNRFIAFTGDAIDTNALELPDISEQFHDIFNAHAGDLNPDPLSNAEGRPNSPRYDGPTTQQRIFDAIDAVRPRDIGLDSEVTNVRADGSVDLDPSWTTESDSGTRLAEVEDGWIYRKGMFGLNALQVVALEEAIVTEPGAYPDGEDFWNAVDALRERGADIPKRPGEGDESNTTNGRNPR